jgi:hypothetical protein
MITERELYRGMTTVKGVWFALFASLILYVFIAPLVFDTSALSLSPEGYQSLRMALYGFTVLTLIATWLIRRYLMAATHTKKSAKSQQHPAIARYLLVMIISMGMSEAIGVYGLVLYVLGKSSQDLYLLTLLSAAAMVLYYPKKEEIVALDERLSVRSGR